MGNGRRALVIGVGTYEQDGLASRVHDLEDVGPKAEEAAARLVREGYTLVTPRPLIDPCLDEMARELNGLDQPADSIVLHYVGHGVAGKGPGSYYVSAHDSGDDLGQTWFDLGALVNRWNETDSASPILVVLDACQSGALSQQALLGSSPKQRIRVIAASLPDREAYRARLSQAFTTVMREAENGDLGIAPALEHIPLEELFRRIGYWVDALCDRDANPPMGQEVVLSQTVDYWRRDVSSVPLPFFRNPAFDPSVRDRHRRLEEEVPDGELRKALAALAADGDPAHFIGAGRGRPHPSNASTARGGASSFVGRAAALSRIGSWLAARDAASLCVVAGGAGVGKSAVLGVIACTLHPVLRGAAPEVAASLREFEPTMSPAHRDVVVIQAANREAFEVLEAIARQLGMDTALLREGRADALGGWLAAEQRRPLIILDAVDEALHPQGLIHSVIRPLALGTGATCRILVGSRTDHPTRELLEEARLTGTLIDLDEADPDELRRDLTEYFGNRLQLEQNFDDVRLRDTVAGSLAVELLSRTPRLGSEFLVAQIIGERIARAGVGTLAGAIQQIPIDMPHLFGQEVEHATAGRPLVRCVLAALSWAQGEGMPKPVLARAASAFQPGGAPAPTVGEVETALASVRFYTRRATGPDGTQLFRYRFDSFAAYLRMHPEPKAKPEAVREYADSVLGALLGALRGNERNRDWHFAEPYLIHYGIEHARLAGDLDELVCDPGFLVHGDPDSLRQQLDRGALRTPMARAYADVYRASWESHRKNDPQMRRQILAIDATRLRTSRSGDEEAAEALTRLAELLRPGWLVRWTRGAFATRSFISTPEPVDARSLAVDAGAGQPIAVFGGADGRIRRWDLAHDRIARSEPGHRAPVTYRVRPDLDHVALATVDGRRKVVTGGEDGILRIWDAETLEEEHWGQCTHPTNPDHVEGGHAEISGLIVTTLRGRPVAIASAFKCLFVFDLATGESVGPPLCPSHRGLALIDGLAVGTGSDGPLIYTGRPDGIWSYTLNSGREHQITAFAGPELLMGKLVAFEAHGRRLLAYGTMHAVVVRDAESGQRVAGWQVASGDLLVGLNVLSTLDGPLLSASVNGAVTIFDPLTGRVVSQIELSDSSVPRVGLLTLPSGVLQMVTTGWHGRLLELRDQIGTDNRLAPRIVGAKVDGNVPATILAFDQSPSMSVLSCADGSELGPTRSVGSRPDGRPQTTTLSGQRVLVTVSEPGKSSSRRDRFFGLSRATKGYAVAAQDLESGHTVDELRFANQGDTIGSPHATVVSDGHRRIVVVANPRKVLDRDSRGRVWDSHEEGTLSAYELTASRRDRLKFTAETTESPSCLAACTFRGRPAVAVGFFTGGLSLYDAMTGEVMVGSLADSGSTVTRIDTIDVDGSLIAFATHGDGSLRLWDLSTEELWRDGMASVVRANSDIYGRLSFMTNLVSALAGKDADAARLVDSARRLFGFPQHELDDEAVMTYLASSASELRTESLESLELAALLVDDASNPIAVFNSSSDMRFVDLRAGRRVETPPLPSGLRVLDATSRELVVTAGRNLIVLNMPHLSSCERTDG